MKLINGLPEDFLTILQWGIYVWTVDGIYIDFLHFPNVGKENLIERNIV